MDCPVVDGPAAAYRGHEGVARFMRSWHWTVEDGKAVHYISKIDAERAA